MDFAADWREQLLRDQEVWQGVQADTDALVRRARMLAPRRTGAGAESVHGELSSTVDGVPEGRVSWDREHDYLRFQDYVGSRHGQARHFLEQAAQEVSG